MMKPVSFVADEVRPESATLRIITIVPASQDGTHSQGNAMRNRKWSRRDVLKTSSALAAGVLFAEPLTRMAQKFGPADYCSLMALGLVMHWWSVPAPVRQTLGIGALALAVNLLPNSAESLKLALTPPSAVARISNFLLVVDVTASMARHLTEVWEALAGIKLPGPKA